MKLGYVIEFVSDMNRAVKFYRDVLGFQLKFESPGWSEFVTGETRLALHPASQKKYRRNRGVGLHCSRRSGVPQGNEREGCAVQDAADEAGLRRSAGAVRGFRGRTFQRRHSRVVNFRQRTVIRGVARTYTVAAFVIRLVFVYFSNNSCSACNQSSTSCPSAQPRST